MFFTLYIIADIGGPGSVQSKTNIVVSICRVLVIVMCVIVLVVLVMVVLVMVTIRGKWFQQIVHRYCAGVGEPLYKSLSSDGAEPFLCYYCFRAQKDEQVSMLLNVIESMKKDISALKAKDAEVLPSSHSYSSATKEITPESTRGESRTFRSNSYQQTLNHERKFNAILFGVNECAKGLSRLARYESDLNSVVSTLSSIDPSFQSRSIRDCFRLGKFSPNASRPRPLLIKFFRVVDVSNILSKRRALLKPYSLKPDMSYEQRVIKSNLLKERWSLIQSGTNRSDIKIRGNNLYLCGKLHGRATMSEFKPACQPPDQVVSPSGTSYNAQRDKQCEHCSDDVSTHTSLTESNTSSSVNTNSQSVFSAPSPLASHAPVPKTPNLPSPHA